MAAPANSGESDMATEEHFILTSHWKSPSTPRPFLHSFNSMVVYDQRSGQSMDNPRQNQQQHEEDRVEPLPYLAGESGLLKQPLTPAAPPISRTNPYAGISQRPANSEDQSDMATDEHFDVTSLLNLPQLLPPPSPSSSSNSMVVYQRSGQSSMNFVDPTVYIARDLALWRQKLLQFWIDQSDNWGPRGGILTMNKQNLPQSLECLGISVLHLYVEDEFSKLYWRGELWEQLYVYLYRASLLLPGEKFVWMYTWDNPKLKNYGQGLFATERVSMGVWRIGPREWVAKVRFQRHNLPTPFFINEQGHLFESLEVNRRNLQVVLDDARLHFPNLVQVFHVAEPSFRPKNRVADFVYGEFDKEGIPQLNLDTLQASGVTFGTSSGVLEEITEEITPPRFVPAARLENPDEDFVEGQVGPVGIGGEVKEKVEIAEAPLNSGKRKGMEKTPRRERGNKKTSRVKNVIRLEKILQVQEMHLKDAAELLKVSRSALKRACREYGINDPSPELFLNKKTEECTRAFRTGIPLLQQEKPNDGLECSVETGNDEFEAFGIGSERTVECQMAELNLNDEFKAVGTGSESTVECQMADSVIVKAKYGSYTIKFRLYRPWGKANLEEQVKKRLPKLEAGTYLIRYKDDEDGELILITCDEDLQLYIETSRQKDTTTSIVVLLEQKVADEFCVDQL